MMVPNERHFCIWNGVTVRDSIIAIFFKQSLTQGATVFMYVGFRREYL